ncbi:MAG: HPF/RaiA family ribosome-associated protein [Candidatus Staskawiczbacteria bacterium]|nr:HPF/RaiA family ribosome-associated protein [Candidatus Staskawiczbacteria bacterium]
MKIIIKAKNINLSGELNNFIEERFYGLKKFIDILKYEDEIGKTLAEVFVEVEKETMHHKKGNIFRVKSRVYLPGREIISMARADDLQKAIIEAKDELKLEIEKYKEKKITLHDRRARKLKSQIVK